MELKLTKQEAEVLRVTLDQAIQMADPCPDPWCEEIDGMTQKKLLPILQRLLDRVS